MMCVAFFCPIGIELVPGIEQTKIDLAHELLQLSWFRAIRAHIYLKLL